jgi:hypothetical protein
LVGKSPNSYATPLGFDYYLLSAEEHAFEWPNGTEKHAIRDVLGCGLLLSPKNRLSIFFTFNGILLGQFFSCRILLITIIKLPILQANKFQSTPLGTFSFQL